MAKREENEFVDFVHDTSTRLLRLAWMLTGERARAEDLVQEAYARLYVAWPRVDPGGRLPYVRRILVNLHRDGHRRLGRETLQAVTPEGMVLDRSGDIATSDLLRRALDQLSPRERECVVLRHHADLSEAQVADLLGIGLGTVKSSTSRGLQRLRADLLVQGERHA